MLMPINGAGATSPHSPFTFFCNMPQQLLRVIVRCDRAPKK
jgi:hypothetical protein